MVAFSIIREYPIASCVSLSGYYNGDKITFLGVFFRWRSRVVAHKSRSTICSLKSCRRLSFSLYLFPKSCICRRFVPNIMFSFLRIRASCAICGTRTVTEQSPPMRLIRAPSSDSPLCRSGSSSSQESILPISSLPIVELSMNLPLLKNGSSCE